MTMLIAALLWTQAADPELTAALQKLGATDRYAFKVESSVQGGSNTNGTVVEGRFEKDRPVWMKSGEVEAFRRGTQLVVLKAGGWKRVEEDADRRRRGSPAALRSLRLPHEELPAILKQFKEIKKLDEKEGEQTVYLGEMTEDAAKAFLDANTNFDRRPEGVPAGTGRFWVTASGDLAMVEVIVRIKGKKNRDAGASTWITLSQIGTAKGEIPEGVIRALEDK
jgi:hypothetical protein